MENSEPKKGRPPSWRPPHFSTSDFRLWTFDLLNPEPTLRQLLAMRGVAGHARAGKRSRAPSLQQSCRWPQAPSDTACSPVTAVCAAVVASATFFSFQYPWMFLKSTSRRAAALAGLGRVSSLDRLVQYAVQLADLLHVNGVVGVSGDLHAGGGRTPLSGGRRLKGERQGDGKA